MDQPGAVLSGVTIVMAALVALVAGHDEEEPRQTTNVASCRAPAPSRLRHLIEIAAQFEVTAEFLKKIRARWHPVGQQFQWLAAEPPFFGTME
jgi:hypothetical protein